MNYSTIKVIAFDCFGTVFDMSTLARDDISGYVATSRDKHGEEWQPLNLSDAWYELRAHPDSAEGIRKLRRKFKVCTLSNGPFHLLEHISRNAGLVWDLIIPIEMLKAYKRHPSTYLSVPSLFRVDPSEVLVVTANPGFGDVEAATQLGMQAVVIRDPLRAQYKNILAMAYALD